MIDEWGKGAKYWDHAWNPVIGCRKVSEGCANCYAAQMAERFPELRDKDGGFSPHRTIGLKKPPKKGVVFVGNMTDILGEWNSDDEIRRWLSALSPDADNLVLTKRTQRLATKYVLQSFINVGMTAENQERFDERIEYFSNFMQTGVPWLSAEPLLGPIDMKDPLIPFKWVVIGAESGPNRRPCKLEWVREIVEYCLEFNRQVFVKQLDIDGKLVKDISKFPEDLQIRQVPWKKV